MKYDVNLEEKKTYEYKVAVCRYCVNCKASCAIFINRDAMAGIRKSVGICPNCGMDYTKTYEEEIDLAVIDSPVDEKAVLATYGENLEKFKLYLAIDLSDQYREEVTEYMEKGIRLKPQGEQNEEGA